MHWISQVVAARALYSAYNELLEIVYFFLDFHEIRD